MQHNARTLILDTDTETVITIKKTVWVAFEFSEINLHFTVTEQGQRLH